MAVIAVFTYEVRPGRFADFMAKLQKAASRERFVAQPDSPERLQSVQLLAEIWAPEWTESSPRTFQ
jgi:hypothetical protein